MSDKPEQKAPAGEEADKELADLLDSALADFSKEDSAKTDEAAAKTETAVEEGDQEWSQDFIKEAAQQFETNIASLLGDANGGDAVVSPEQLQASFKKMADAAKQALTNPGIDDPNTNDFASAISETLNGLSQGTANLQAPFSEANLMDMFANQSGEQNSFLPFMQGMMQSLLSKEVLYPSLKDILDKYPAWLQENDATLPPDDKERYIKQHELMQQVCSELEKETEADSADVRKARFDKVLGMMQSLQDYGQPPTELVSDVSPATPFDQQGNPDCSIM